MGVFVGRSDGSHVVVQSLADTRPPEVGDVPPGGVYAFMLVEPGPDGQMATWIVADATGHMLKRIGPMPTDFDPRKRPWYGPGMAADAPIMIPPYRFANVPEAGITLARRARMHPDAVFGIDMTLASIDLYLDRLRIPAELELVIFDEAGTLIAHPRGNAYRSIQQANQENRLLKVTDLHDTVLSEMYGAFRSLSGKEVRSLSFDVGGVWYFGRTERVGGEPTDLFISLAIPYEAMMGPAERIRYNLLTVSVVLVLAALLIVLVASRRLASPLRIAAEDIRRVMRFEFGHAQRQQSRIVEIRELARALDTLELALRNFMRYVPIDLVRGIVGRTFSSELGGVRQPVTVLFTDVAGFTPIAEALEPEAVMEKTSRYFSEVGHELVRTGATIDKYIGDSIMAFWNAPEPRPDHVSRACLGALRAARRLDRLNAEFIAEGGLPMPTRFGLHTGEAIVGNVGSVDRINYTTLGHTVNLASRIEKLSKRYGTSLLASEAVRAAAGDAYVFRFVDRVVPDGAHETIAIHELLGVVLEDEPELLPDPIRAGTLEAWSDVLGDLDAAAWMSAVAKLRVLVAASPNDALFRIHLERCEAALRDGAPRTASGDGPDAGPRPSS
jgi:adenylate cyclase